MSKRAVQAAKSGEDHTSPVLELLKQLDDEALEKIISSAQTSSQNRLRAEVKAFKDGSLFACRFLSMRL